MSLREHLDITKEVNNLIYGDPKVKAKALQILKFYNQAKQVIYRSGGDDNIVNLKILKGLLSELRLRLDLTKEGMAPEKVKQIIDFGGKKGDSQRQKRIETLIL